MMKGPIYSRMVKEGGAALPAVIGRQLSDQGEYPLGLLCCGQGSGTRGVPVFAHAGNVVPLMSVCSLICYRPTWRLMNGDTFCPFCRMEHLWCHLAIFQKLLEAFGFAC
ncbi:hypothetical protein HanPI659440_Chr07g0269441 [Helianthus annuus]|nr:hypothetical protein HanPI659440_Chr07g0269441 [Helianthus annuus]